MRNLYISLAMGLACLTALDASAYSVTVEVDNPNAVTASLNGTPVAFTDGVAEVTYESYESINLTCNDGYVFSDIQLYTPSNDSWNQQYVSSAKNHYISLSGEYSNGYVYKVTTGNLDELRTAKVTLKVDDPSAIQFMRSWTNETFTPTQSETEISYVPGKETPFSIATVSGKNLYKLTVNDSEVSGSYGRYTIYNVNDGDVIEATSIYPEIDYDLTFNLSEACKEGFITSVTVDNQAIDNWENAKVRIGSSVSVAFNTSDFKINKFEMNGSSIGNYGYFYSPYTFTMSDNVVFDIDAAPYGTAKMTIKVDKADYVILYKGYNSADPSSIFALNDGETTIEVSETISQINLCASSLATITSVTQDGSPLSKDYSNKYALSVKDGSVIEVETEEIRRDNTMIVYFDSPTKANDYVNFYGYSFRANDSQRNIELTEGYNEVKFGNVDGQFMFTVNNGRTDNVFLYVNGETPTFSSDYVTHYFYPEDGDVLKCFVGTKPEIYTLSFTIDNGLSTPVVTVDKITKLDNLDTTTVLQGTHVCIAPQEGDTYKSVTVGGKEVEPVDGNYEFVVNANSPVVITRTALGGVIGIDAEENAETVIYNLQGIRVDGNNIPAGIYIVNGKKTVIR